MLHAKFNIPRIYIDRYFHFSDLVSKSLSKYVSLSEWLIELLSTAPGQRPGADLIILNILKSTTWNIGDVQLANWSILVF